MAPVTSYDMRMNVSDETLALAAADGDPAAFEALILRHYDRLFALCFRLFGHRAEAEDLTQDICAALPAKIASYQAQSKFTTWLYRVTINAATDRRRKAVTYGRAMEGWGSWEINRQNANSAEAAEILWLHDAMSQLNDSLRDTLALIMDDLSHAEVGEVLDVPAGTVSWRVSEAKRLLREIREKEETQ